MSRARPKLRRMATPPLIRRIELVEQKVTEHEEWLELHDERLDRHERDIAEIDRELRVLRDLERRAKERERARLASNRPRR